MQLKNMINALYSSQRGGTKSFEIDGINFGWRAIIDKIQKHFQNVMLVGMASEISKNYTYKCVDRSRHNGAKAKCAH